jgi:hypothetical protein
VDISPHVSARLLLTHLYCCSAGLAPIVCSPHPPSSFYSSRSYDSATAATRLLLLRSSVFAATASTSSYVIILANCTASSGKTPLGTILVKYPSSEPVDPCHDVFVVHQVTTPCGPNRSYALPVPCPNYALSQRSTDMPLHEEVLVPRDPPPTHASPMLAHVMAAHES